MKRNLVLMLAFSLLAHIAVGGTLIYFPLQSYNNESVRPSGNIFCSIVQGEATGGGEEKSEVRRQKQEVRRQKSEIRSKIQEDRSQMLEDRGKKQDEKREESGIREQEVEAKGPVIGDEEDKSDLKISNGCNEEGRCTTSLAFAGTASPGDTINNTGINKEGNNDALRGFLEYIREEIEKKKYYPLFARENGIEGTVYVNFHLGSNGTPDDVKIGKSSGSKLLDESAIRTIKDLKKVPEIPEQMRKLDVTVPIAYRLNNNQ